MIELKDFLPKVSAKLRDKVRGLLNGCPAGNTDELIRRFLEPVLNDNNDNFEKIIQSPLFERFMTKYKSTHWGDLAINPEVNFLHLSDPLFRKIDNIEKALFLIELARLAGLDLDLNSVEYNLMFGGLTQNAVDEAFKKCLKNIQQKIVSNNKPGLDGYKVGDLDALFRLYKRNHQLDSPPVKNPPPKKDEQISYENNLSDHHPQRAVITSNTSAKQHHIMIWNITKKCGPFGAGYNNGFGVIEDGEDKKYSYSKRINDIGEKLNETIKNDSTLGIILLQEVSGNPRYLGDRATAGCNWSHVNNTNELVTLYDKSKYVAKPIPPELAPLAISKHAMLPTLLKDRNSPEILLVVNIHALYDPALDDELIQKLDALEKHAKAKGYKLVIGGDFNRDIKTNFNLANPNLSADHGGDGSYSYDGVNKKTNPPNARDGVVVGAGLTITNIKLAPEINQTKVAALDKAKEAEVKVPAKAEDEAPDKPAEVAQTKTNTLFSKEEVEDYLKSNYKLSGNSISRGFGEVPISMRVGEKGELGLRVGTYNEAALDEMLKIMAQKLKDHGEPMRVKLSGGNKSVEYMKKRCAAYGLEFEAKKEEKKDINKDKDLTAVKFPADNVDKSLIPTPRITGKMRS